MLFWTSALASTIPIPSGIFIPVLKMGAAYGRLLGELMHLAFPDGINWGNYPHPVSIVPGSYAVVGAAAFSGAVTHTISTSVILFEMTGQIVHIIPVILGVLIANAVCQSLQPSIYDSIIEIKKLPYLPPIASSNSISHKILVKDFMNTKLAFVWKDKCTYADLKNLLSEHKKILSFPLVESAQSMKLLGSVPRSDLLKLLYMHLGHERRLQEVQRRNSDSLSSSSLTNNEDHGLEFKPKALALDGVLGKSHTLPIKQSKDSDNEDCASRNGDSNMDQQQLVDAIGLSTSLNSTESNEESDTMGIARMVNHYNRGTSMEDEQRLKEENSKLEELSTNGLHLATLITKPTSEAKITELSRDRDDLGQAMRSLPTVGELRVVPIYHSESRPPISRNTSQNSSSTSKPTKSILKTSSSTSTFSNLYRRNISSQSFYGSFNLNPASNGEVKRTVTPTHLQPDIFTLSADSANMLNMEEGGTPARQRRKVRLPRLRVVDMTIEEQEKWEKEQLDTHIDVSRCQIDEAPFQLVEQTSLYRVHTLFSMLGLNHAYVTSFGRLVGIVALKDIRFAIEKMLQEKK